MFLRQPIIANDYFMIITIIGPTINRSDASLKSNPREENLAEAVDNLISKLSEPMMITLITNWAETF